MIFVPVSQVKWLAEYIPHTIYVTMAGFLAGNPTMIGVDQRPEDRSSGFRYGRIGKEIPQ